MILFVKDRLYIPAILPRENTFKGFSLKKSIIEQISLSEEYRKEIGFQQDKKAEQITWDNKKDTGVQFKFTSDEYQYISKSCEAMLEQTLPDDMWQSISRIYESANALINN